MSWAAGRLVVLVHHFLICANHLLQFDQCLQENTPGKTFQLQVAAFCSWISDRNVLWGIGNALLREVNFKSRTCTHLCFHSFHKHYPLSPRRSPWPQVRASSRRDSSAAKIHSHTSTWALTHDSKRSIAPCDLFLFHQSSKPPWQRCKLLKAWVFADGRIQNVASIGVL